MTIDLKRLAVDADYWDEVAPEGASHLIDEFTFTKWEYGQEFSWDIGRDTAWVADDSSYSLSRYLKEGDRWKVLAKPIKPAKPKSHPTDTQLAEPEAQISAKWDGRGVPFFCWRGECTWGAKISWSECIMLTGGQIAKEYFGKWEVFSIDQLYKIEFRPMPSQSEKDRDLAIDHAFSKLTEFREARQVLGDLYDAGLLPKVNKP
jgi:hypothetical protein